MEGPVPGAMVYESLGYLMSLHVVSPHLSIEESRIGQGHWSPVKSYQKADLDSDRALYGPESLSHLHMATGDGLPSHAMSLPKPHQQRDCGDMCTSSDMCGELCQIHLRASEPGEHISSP